MDNTKLRLRRLGWAGVELEFNGETLLIDYIQDTKPLVQLRSPQETFLPSSQPGKAIAALVTHLHADHADPEALTIALQENAPVLRPEPAAGTDADLALTEHVENQFKKYDLATQLVQSWEQHQIGPFKIYSAPAICGFGDPQVSWVVECNGKRIFHTGDTIFHGFWWRIANRFGPMDVAFLTINGPIVNFPLLQPASPLEVVMTPEQATVAASILRAKMVVPIHYGSLHKPPVYTETADVLLRFENQMKNNESMLFLKDPGEWFEVD